MDDKSFLSIETNSQANDTQESALNLTNLSSSDSLAGPGLPPNFDDSFAEEEGPDGNHDEEEDYEDEPDEHVDENVFSPSDIYDDSIIDPSQYSNENIQSLLPAILTSDGHKLKQGYTADEMDAVIRDIIGYDLETITRQLIGDDGMSQIKSGLKTDLCHALVAKNYLKFDKEQNFTFFPVIGQEHVELVSQIVAGAEADSAYRETKKIQKQYKNEEEEIRAMRTFNMFVLLIQSICNSIQRMTAPYQKILDGYNEMLRGVSHFDVMNRYDPLLKLSENPSLNTTWFRHFTGRSSLRSFISMDKFSGIFMDHTQNQPEYGVSRGTQTFNKEQFTDVLNKWKNDNNDKAGNYNRVTERPARKKDLSPDPNFQRGTLVAEGDDEDYFNPNRATSSRSPPSRERSVSPYQHREKVDYGGFGAPPPRSENEKVRAPPSVVHNTQHMETNYSESESSDGSDGEYSDETEEMKIERVKDNELKKANRRERRRLMREQEAKQPKLPRQTKPNRFDKSTFGDAETPRRFRPPSDEKSDENDDKEPEVQQVEDDAESENEGPSVRNTTRRKFDTDSSLPVTVVDGLKTLSLMDKHSKRPQLPHEPSAAQMIKNKEEKLEQSMRRAAKKQKQTEREEYERSLREDNNDVSRREFQEDEKEVERKRLEAKQELYRQEEEERKKYEMMRADEEMARRLHCSINPEPPRSRNVDQGASSSTGRSGSAGGKKSVLNKQGWNTSPTDPPHANYDHHYNNSRNNFDPMNDRVARSPPRISDDFHQINRSAFREPMPRYGDDYRGGNQPGFNVQQPSNRLISPVYQQPYRSAQQSPHDYQYRGYPSGPAPVPSNSGYSGFGRRNERDPYGGPSDYVPPYHHHPDMRYDRNYNGHSHQSSPSVDQDIPRFCQRIATFIQECAADDEIVTDTLFIERYPYYKPAQFNLAEFVRLYMPEVRVKRVKVANGLENIYTLQ